MCDNRQFALPSLCIPVGGLLLSYSLESLPLNFSSAEHSAFNFHCLEESKCLVGNWLTHLKIYIYICGYKRRDFWLDEFSPNISERKISLKVFYLWMHMHVCVIICMHTIVVCAHMHVYVHVCLCTLFMYMYVCMLYAYLKILEVPMLELNYWCWQWNNATCEKHENFQD